MKIVFFIIMFAACGICWTEEAPAGDVYEPVSGVKPEIASGPKPVRKEPVYLYFTEPGGRHLTAEIRDMDDPGDTAAFCRNIVEALIGGPSGFLGPVLDPDTEIFGVYTDSSKTAYVDLSKNLRNLQPGGVRRELLSVYSIVNSLVLNSDGIDRVKILLDGNEAETFSGHIDIEHPVKARMLLIR